jgi:hypothetical protein
LIRYDQAVSGYQRALAEIRRHEQNWRPTTTESLGAPGSIETATMHAEARAQEAISRLDRLRSGIGGNLGPPLGPTEPSSRSTVPTSSQFDGRSWIGLYRTANNMRDLFGHPMWPYDKGTVAVAEMDGNIQFGVSSGAPGYELIDRATANEWRSRLLDKYSDIIKRGDDIGRIPNNSLYHAEATILMRMARENGGTLAGRAVEIHVDRELCYSCNKVLPFLVSELGSPTVTFVSTFTGERTVLSGSR